MKQSTQTVLWVACGAALLYYFAKSKGTAAATLPAANAANPNMGGQNFGVCPTGGWCGLCGFQRRI